MHKKNRHCIELFNIIQRKKYADWFQPLEIKYVKNIHDTDAERNLSIKLKKGVLFD